MKENGTKKNNVDRQIGIESRILLFFFLSLTLTLPLNYTFSIQGNNIVIIHM